MAGHDLCQQLYEETLTNTSAARRNLVGRDRENDRFLLSRCLLRGWDFEGFCGQSYQGRGRGGKGGGSLRGIPFTAYQFKFLDSLCPSSRLSIFVPFPLFSFFTTAKAVVPYQRLVRMRVQLRNFFAHRPSLSVKIDDGHDFVNYFLISRFSPETVIFNLKRQTDDVRFRRDQDSFEWNLIAISLNSSDHLPHWEISFQLSRFSNFNVFFFLFPNFEQLSDSSTFLL